MKIICALVLLAVAPLSTPVFAEQLTYNFTSSENGEEECSGQISKDENAEAKMEKKRRTMIETYNLSGELKWKQGRIRNEWGDEKESFCYLESGGKAYIYRSHAYIIFGKDEVRSLTN
jgi:hypothetical protein